MGLSLENMDSFGGREEVNRVTKGRKINRKRKQDDTEIYTVSFLKNFKLVS